MNKYALKRYIDREVARAIRREDALRRRNDIELERIKDKAISLIKKAISKLDPRDSKAEKAKKTLLKGLKAIAQGGAGAIKKVVKFYKKEIENGSLTGFAIAMLLTPALMKLVLLAPDIQRGVENNVSKLKGGLSEATSKVREAVSSLRGNQ